MPQTCLPQLRTTRPAPSFPWLIIASFILLLLSGCGTKEKAPTKVLDEGAKRIELWQKLIEAKQTAPIQEKLTSVNDFINKLEFVDDLAHWGKEDYWATPREMLATNGGDCEDFAIAKYFTLRKLGIPDDQLRLTYVKSLTLKKPHMVINYFAEPNAEPLVLDNFVPAILPASQRPDLFPVYSFNGDGLWLAKQKGNSEYVGKNDKLSLWHDLQERLRQEAFATTVK